MSSRFQLKNVGAFQKRLEDIVKKMPDNVMKALKEEAEIEATESRRRTPVDTGALRASTVVEAPKSEGGTLSVTISVGGPTASYAMYVHEDLEAHHPVGQAKFLESTLNESAPYMANRLAKRLKLD